MEHQTGLFIFIIAIIVLIFLVVWWYMRGTHNETQTITQLKQAYDQAIQDGNKRLALQRGREYYARLRGGKLSMFDELAIANDLSTIDNVAIAGTRLQPVQEISK